MALAADKIAEHPALHASIRRQSQALLQSYEANPRLASVFATQQRWLLAHIGAAVYFRSDPLDRRKGLHASRYLELVREHAVASRNTADAFLKEMINYNFVRYVPGNGDRRFRPLEPSQTTLETLSGWAMVHLSTLDALDGERRLETYLQGSNSLARLQPLIADGLLSSPAVREPPRTFSLFTWLNNGGIVMDWMIAGIEPANVDADRISTGVLSVADMARWFKISRTHLARKLRDAEALGSIGWQGQRGNSVMWVSKEFRAEYATAQAVKLSIIDAAFERCFRGPAS